MKDDVGLPVQQAGGLLLHGGDDARVAVAGVRHADAGGEVEVALARLVVEAAALGPLDDYLRQVRPDRRQTLLRAGDLSIHVIPPHSCGYRHSVVVTRV